MNGFIYQSIEFRWNNLKIHITTTYYHSCDHILYRMIVLEVVKKDQNRLNNHLNIARFIIQRNPKNLIFSCTNQVESPLFDRRCI